MIVEMQVKMKKRVFGKEKGQCVCVSVCVPSYPHQRVTWCTGRVHCSASTWWSTRSDNNAHRYGTPIHHLSRCRISIQSILLIFFILCRNQPIYYFNRHVQYRRRPPGSTTGYVTTHATLMHVDSTSVQSIRKVSIELNLINSGPWSSIVD